MKSPELDTPLASQHASDTWSETRFGVGENWRRFPRAVDETRIAAATDQRRPPSTGASLTRRGPAAIIPTRSAIPARKR